MKTYVVIDTNVIVSAFLKSGSIPYKILAKVYDGFLIPVINEKVLEEYLRVLHRSKFNFSRIVIDEFMEFLNHYALNVECLEESKIKLLDENDIVFYQVTMEIRKKENAYLITGNIKHFPKETFVVTPRQMLDIIENDTCSKIDKL